MVTSRFSLVATAILSPLAGAQTITLEPHTIRDAAISNTEAVTFLKPKGWKVSGGIQWYHNHAHLACLEMKVAKPDSIEQIETHPWAYLCWFSRPVIAMEKGTNYMGSIVHPPIEHPRDVIEQLTLPNIRKRAKVTGYLDMPEVAAIHSKSMGGAKVKSGRVRVECTLDGQAIEEDFYLSIFVTSANLGVNDSIVYTWGPVSSPFSIRAAKGKLDAATPLMLASVNSAKINQKWFGDYMYVSELFQKRQAQGIRNAKEISDTVRRNGDEIAKMYSDAYWSRQASQSKASQQFSDYIRGVQRFDSPHEKYPVQLPSGFKYVWSSGSGEYRLSNDANENPNVGGTRTWELLKEPR